MIGIDYFGFCPDLQPALRGIVDQEEEKRNGKDANNIADGFRISGLGQLIEAGIQSDRLVSFGD